MKRFIILGILAVVFMGIQFLVNCSSPLEGVDKDDSTPSGPGDSVDTIFTMDTLIVVDTLTDVDTVVIIVPGSGGSQMVCSRIASNQTEIVWMFRNAEGLYGLEFVASAESDHPKQMLTVDIDGEEFQWNPGDSPELSKALYLEQNATIRITSRKPPSLGHTIHICLTVTAP